MKTRAVLAALWRWMVAGQLAGNLLHLSRAAREARVLQASGLFDAEWYGRDPELASWRFGAALHYVLRGAAEGRAPSAAFDGDFYLRSHPDVAVSGMNPLLHYVLHGRVRGLATRPAPASRVARLPLCDASYRTWLAECEALSGAPPVPAGEPVVLVLAEDVAAPADFTERAVLFLAAGVLLANGALAVFQQALRELPDADMIYGDEDRIGADGLRCAPWFKPDWDPDLALACDLAGPAVLFRRSLLGRLGWDGAPLGAGALPAFSLRAAAHSARVAHVPQCVAHRVAAGGDRHFTRVTFAVPQPAPLVSVIIPTRDRARLLGRAADGVLHGTDYPAVELILVDNDSTQAATRRLLNRLSRDERVRVIAVPGAFNWSALNNRGAAAAAGQVLVLLNNDVEILEPGWLHALVAHVIRPEIGVAGAKLLYPDGSVQHAGIVLGPAGVSCHVLRGADGKSGGPYGELSVTRTVSAVTGACLAIRREVFEEVGGLEAVQFAVTNNDIDLCLKVRAAGYRVVVAPGAVLMHREAATRGPDLSPAQLARAGAERVALLERWGGLARRDPYLNPNLCVLRRGLGLEMPSRLVAEGQAAAFRCLPDSSPM